MTDICLSVKSSYHLKVFNLQYASDDVEERNYTLQDRKYFSPCGFPSSSKHVCDI